MVCGNFILPEFCKPCLFLSFFNLRNLLYLIRYCFRMDEILDPETVSSVSVFGETFSVE